MRELHFSVRLTTVLVRFTAYQYRDCIILQCTSTTSNTMYCYYELLVLFYYYYVLLLIVTIHTLVNKTKSFEHSFGHWRYANMKHSINQSTKHIYIYTYILYIQRLWCITHDILYLHLKSSHINFRVDNGGYYKEPGGPKGRPATRPTAWYQ